MKLSWSECKAYTGWRKYIGRTTAGKPKCFYLGKDRDEAERLALTLTLAYKAIIKAGGRGWTDDTARAAQADEPLIIMAPPAAHRVSGLHDRVRSARIAAFTSTAVNAVSASTLNVRMVRV